MTTEWAAWDPHRIVKIVCSGYLLAVVVSPKPMIGEELPAALQA